MAQLKGNEWNFTSNAAARISEVLKGEAYQRSPLGHAGAELTEAAGAKRLDLVLFDRELPGKPLITAELKVPWDALGRTPHNTEVVEDAHRKASKCGAKFFVTWNIRRAVVWRTDDPGVPLLERVVADKELIPVALTKSADLSRPEFVTTWPRAVAELVELLHQLLVGPAKPAYLPLDRLFIARLESLLDFPVELTAAELRERMAKNAAFRRRAEAWMRDRQGWIVSPATMEENIDRASRFTCYVLVNRLCFHTALRRKYPKLDRLAVPNGITTGVSLQARLTKAFGQAMTYTGDYDTVFETDPGGDDFPFLSDAAVPEWRRLVQSLESYDFASIPLEIIGAMYERLLSPEERHRYGQHYTQPAVVDLINAFSLSGGRATVLDPACGGGTFLVRAYGRKRHLDIAQDHSEVLASIYGCDLLRYACHLSVINLAVRDLIDDENYPRIHPGDFLEVTPNVVFAELPTRLVAGGLPTGKTRQLRLAAHSVDAVVGNPPYIQATELAAGQRATYLGLARREWPDYNWSGASDILVWFFTHSATFLRAGGYLSLLTQSAWLDVEYGVPLQQWMLDNFRVVAVLESEAEPWFTDARVATAVTVLARETDAARRDHNLVRFVQFRTPLRRSEAGDTEAARQQIAEGLRDAILAPNADAIEPRFRVRLVRQADLRQRGIDPIEGTYAGSRWGRYLRALEAIYTLQRDHAASFCALGELAEVERGVTTNCDKFFIVTDATQGALDRYPAPSEFLNRFGIRRAAVESGTHKIIRRNDGTEMVLEAKYLVPTLKTARDVNVRSTSAIINDVYAVRFPVGARSALSKAAEAYIAAGEREKFHEATSFRGRADWYILRATDTAPILFVKTIQYVPQVLWNDADLLANQRLYNVKPRDGVDPEALGAILNSTVFAGERFAGVKALGREAANDVEVFTARQFRVPDVRAFTPAELRTLRAAFVRLRKREIGTLLEATLMDAGQKEARVYVDQHPVSAAVWPEELRDPDRQQIDTLILRRMGMTAAEAEATRVQLYNELVAFTRRAKLLELEAQVNRRGRGGEAPTAAQLADSLWADLTANGHASIRTLPDDFLTPGGATTTLSLPAGRVAAEEDSLFDRGRKHALRFGRDHVVPFDSAAQRDLAALLAEHVRGEITLPRDAADCTAATAAIRTYLGDVLPKLKAGAAEITENVELRDKIVGEAAKRLQPRRPH
jgi:hypothetical protein